MGSGASRAACVGPTGIKDVTLNHTVTDKYMQLSQHGKVQAESLRWISFFFCFFFPFGLQELHELFQNGSSKDLKTHHGCGRLVLVSRSRHKM